MTDVRIRQQAIQGLDDLGRLDAPLATVSARTWLLLVAGIALVAGGVVWLVFGSAPRLAQGPALMLSVDSLGEVAAPTSGTTVAIRVGVGDAVRVGQPVVGLLGPEGVTRDVRVAGRGGTVLEVASHAGDWVSAGDPLLLLGEPGPVNEAVAVMVPSDGLQVRPGMPAAVEPVGVSSTRFGSILATVTQVRPIAAPSQLLKAITGGNDSLVGMLGQRPGVLVVVALAADPGDPSGYAWTSGSGPDRQLTLGEPATITVTLETSAPWRALFGS